MTPSKKLILDFNVECIKTVKSSEYDQQFFLRQIKVLIFTIFFILSHQGIYIFYPSPSINRSYIGQRKLKRTYFVFFVHMVFENNNKLVYFL